ncbi:MAG TPA: SCO family protein [Planctomycetota bacterium]
MRAALAALVAVLLLAPTAPAQIVGGPRPPDVAWTQALGARLPLEQRFVDHTGRELALGQCLAGRPVVLALVYYECPMLCGLVLEGLVSALRAVDFAAGSDFDVLVLSIDPGETAALAAAKREQVLATLGLAPDDARAAGWRFLVGAEPAIRAVTAAAGFVYQYVPERDEWAHGAGITLLSPEGVVSRILFGAEFAPRDLRFALIEASQGKIGTPLDQVLLRCFHYDPTRGKYGLAILVVVRTLGTLTLLLLGFFVLRWLRQERRRVPATVGGA